MYFVPFENGEDLLIEKKSKFIGRIIKIESEKEAKEHLEAIRKAEKGAVHNCYAYIVREENIERFSDDGEPQGTAGKPILEVIQKEGITNVLCVVTRYFGGTLLGTGGLVRAYNQSAKGALINAGIAKMLPFLSLAMNCEYNMYDIILKKLEDFTIYLGDTDYTDKIVINFDLLSEEKENLDKMLKEVSSGTILANIKEEKYLPFKIGKE